MRKVTLTGNTVFTDEELSGITSEYEGRRISNEELQELRHRLTRFYIDNGYINSGAVIPDQRMEDGVVNVQIIEGEVTDITVVTDRRLRAGYVSERLALGAGPPLNVNDLQERLQILLQDPLVDRVNADLSPGDRAGEARLTARVKESRPYQLRVSLDNNMSPAFGNARLLLNQSLRNLTGWGDTLSSEVRFATGLDDWSLNYSLPVSAHDTVFSVRYRRSNLEVVEEPFDELDPKSKVWSFRVDLSHPFYKTSTQQFTVGLGLDRRKSRSYLLGRRFSFTPGSRNGEADITAIRFSQDWVSRSLSQVFAARSTLTLGIDAFGATDSKSSDDSELSAADSEYFAWLGQFQWARRIGDTGSEFVFRVDGQYADDTLFPLERFAVGGLDSVRGYRRFQLVRDQGFSASLEFRYPIVRNHPDFGTLQLAPFYDIGGARNRKDPTPDPDTISSAGLGLRWDPGPKVHAELYWGYSFNSVDNPNDTLQDDGVHFRLRADLF